MKPSLIRSAVVVFAMLAGACTEGNRDDGAIINPNDADAAADSSQQEVTPIPKLEAGADCQRNDQCESGLCANASAGGKICTAACSDSVACPSGLTCVSENGSGICVKADVVACQPCRTNDDCNLGGLTGNTCIAYGAGGSFCGNACSTSTDCPSGYACEGNACKLSSGECACNAAGIAVSAETDCEVSNEHGTCSGVRGCGAGGLSRCMADTPAAETCNGRDDDCDDETDEGTDGAPCDLTNEFGTCVGVVECNDGRPLCVGPVPAAEICNGKDDNCDGDTDENFDDLDEDGQADCLDDDWDDDGIPNVDDCQPRNPAVHPGSETVEAPDDVCDGVDNDCNDLVDDGEAAACGCYRCAGEDGCLTQCDTNDDVDDGFRCDTEDSNENGNTHECVQSICGNEIVEPGEVCDDGENLGRYGGCFACLELGGFCGDGRRQFEFELCDDGEQNGQAGHCNDTCSGITGPNCGNGVQEEGEDCDLGSTQNSNLPNALCRTDCTNARCGDGIVDTNREEGCDRGNLNGNDGTCGCSLACQFANQAVTCHPVAGACDVAETCDGAGHCPTDVKLNGVVCGAKNGDCDVAETCNGVSDACPVDAVASSVTVCRNAVGDCDVAERCDGTTKNCPLDQVATPQTECRTSQGDCDPSEHCDGEGKDCPDDSFFGSDVPCREKNGDCDVTEFCTGESADCPDDEFDQNFTVCHFPGGACDDFVFCNGESADCAYDGPLGAGTLCRFGNGVCNPDETCDGTSLDCPDDIIADNTTVCRDSAGDCDSVELCDGFGNCPDDSFFGQGTVCRDSVGDCDLPEFCEGNSTVCPEDQLDFNGSICHFGTGDCDPYGFCDGVGVDCSNDGPLPAGTLCRFGDGLCDSSEFCDGESSDCPVDIVADNTTVCRPAAGDCDAVELCDGFGGCPGDSFFGFGTTCREGTGQCDPGEFCEGNSTQCPTDIIYGPEFTCHFGFFACDQNATCDGVNGDCPYDGPLPAGTTCHPSQGDCDPAEACDGESVFCPDNLLADNTTSCRTATGECDAEEFCTGFSTACPPDFVKNSETLCNPGDGDCDPAEFCDGETKLCPDDVVEDDGTDCTESVDCAAASCTCQAGVCEEAPSGRLWCFREIEAVEQFTFDPTDPGGAPAVVGTGVLPLATGSSEVAGNPVEAFGCPTVVTHSALIGLQWGRDVRDTDPSDLQGRDFCDGNQATPISDTDPGAANIVSGALAAAECGDYFEFVADTGATVAFEFDDRSGTSGPTDWALGVFVGNGGQWFEYATLATGKTNGPGQASFGAGFPTPRISVNLTGMTANGVPVTEQRNVHFRLYGFGATSVGGEWAVDNVRVGAPVTRALWCFENATTVAFDIAPTVVETGFANVAVTRGSALTGNTGAAGAATEPPLCPTNVNQSLLGTTWPTAGTFDPASNSYFEVKFDHDGASYSMAWHDQRSSTGPARIAVARVVGGVVQPPVAVDRQTPTAGAFGAPQVVDLGVLSPTTGDVWRIYGYGGTNTAGTYRIDNLTITRRLTEN